MRASPWSRHLEIELSLLHIVKRQNKDIFFSFPPDARISTGGRRRETTHLEHQGLLTGAARISDSTWQLLLSLRGDVKTFSNPSQALDKINLKSQVWDIMWKDVADVSRGRCEGRVGVILGDRIKKPLSLFHSVYFPGSLLHLSCQILADLAWHMQR